tara:strand:- start:65 stop:784 length:720 start_codon:yes stop_codon:yes gene_type:complete
MRKIAFLLSFSLLFSCDQLLPLLESAGSLNTPPTKSEVSSGIKEALTVGIKNTVLKTSSVNGFLNNSLIKIPFPQEAAKVESTVRNLGLGNKVDDFVATLNHGAEEASKKASPIFVNAITSMSINDVYDVWRGDNNAATVYLRNNTESDLQIAFQPVIKQALEKVNLTKYWNPLINTYNKIPLVQKMNPNLDEYVLDKTLDGLFTMLALEEGKIREDPAARVSDLLKKVFGYQGTSSFQ